MSTPARLAAFAATLAVLFAGSALAGGAIRPHREAPDAHGAAEGAHGQGKGDVAEPAHAVRGLAVAEHGLRLVVDRPELRRGRTETLRFRVVDDRGRTVRDFDVAHERRLHLIVVRRDLIGFQHLHPQQAADGSWSVPVELEEAGSYRLFADFARAGAPTTLAADLRVDGAADLEALPAPETRAVSDGGHDVSLEAPGARPGREAQLRFTVTRNDAPVDTESYLGAGGHLVALREGDLAFLHVHPTADDAPAAHDAHDAPETGTGFAVTFPTAGRYRLFLQFKVAGRVETVAFTQEVG